MLAPSEIRVLIASHRLDVNEIVVSTFSGKLLTFWDVRTLDVNTQKMREVRETKAKALGQELTKLKEKVAQTKGTKKDEGLKLAEISQPANVRMTLVPSDAAYLLVVESQTPIVIQLCLLVRRRWWRCRAMCISTFWRARILGRLRV
jgi:hypothetical protein